MEIHKPKPWRGWREFVKEIGTIVIGVLIAIGAEQAVEALHHRFQAAEMAEKLRAESEENRHVVAYDVESLRASVASTDAILAALAKGDRTAAVLQRPDLFRPADAAWIAIRDSALLPIMPKLLIDNAWKVDATNEYLSATRREIGLTADRAEAALAVSQLSPDDAELGRTTRLVLAELRVKEARLIGSMNEFQVINDQLLRGERIDTTTELQKARPRK